MQTVTSADGTRIAYETYGDGSPLILLHGSSTTRHSWRALQPHLEDDFTLVVPDRRGRGESGDADEYGLAREVEDLCALVDSVDGDVSVFGHSFGGLVTLAAATETTIDRLILYEPAILVGEHADDDLSERMQNRLESDGQEAAMELFYQEGAGIPEPERLPIWPEQVNFGLADTVVRENTAIENYELSPEAAVDVPTLLLRGERGPPHLGDAVEALDDHLPQSTVEALDDVGHVGMQSAPEQVATTVESFFAKTVSQS